LQVDRHVDNLTIRIFGPAELEVAKQLTQRGLQPRQLFLLSYGPGGSREAATQLLVSEEYKHLLARIRDLEMLDGKGLTEEMLQVRQLELCQLKSTAITWLSWIPF
jgi:hypothetical protein